MKLYKCKKCGQLLIALDEPKINGIEFLSLLETIEKNGRADWPSSKSFPGEIKVSKGNVKKDGNITLTPSRGFETMMDAIHGDHLCFADTGARKAVSCSLCGSQEMYKVMDKQEDPETKKQQSSRFLPYGFSGTDRLTKAKKEAVKKYNHCKCNEM